MKKKSAKSIPERILELGDFVSTPQTAESIKRELKDRFGHNLTIGEVSKSLLRLFRRGKIFRQRNENDVYEYSTRRIE